MSRCRFLDVIPAFHGVTGGSRNNVVQMDFHGTANGGGVGSGGKVIPSVVHPFAVIYLFTMSTRIVFWTVIVTTFGFPFPVGLPFPAVMPFGTPHTLAGTGLLRIGRQGRDGKVRIYVCCHGIRRNVFIQ